MTEQSDFWKGEFGDDYIARNNPTELLASNIALFSKILNGTDGVDSAIEFGANIGLNLKAIGAIIPDCAMIGVEVNSKAASSMSTIPNVIAFNESFLDKDYPQVSLSFTKGVLIYIHPGDLAIAYEKLYQSSYKYICIIEYYNPSPVEIPYRGHSNKLFKRDFAGELMDLYNDVKLVDYGFVYHRDNNFKQDDLTWFLMEKKNG